jgi:hypothetical protein
MRFAGFVGVVIGLVSSGCSTVGHGDSVSRATIGTLSTVAPQVAFDHNCPEDRIRVIRWLISTVDLDVCGSVRRYKSVDSGLAAAKNTWMDVTNSYPASALPTPLPPALGK